MQNNRINDYLSEQEQKVIENILSIQDYYGLKDHHKLISIIIDQKQSQELFGPKKVMISDAFEKQKDQIDESAKIDFFAEKYSYEILCDKFKKPKSFKNNTLTAILQKKMESSVIGSHNTRKSIWLLASGALFSMKNNKNLYEGLIKYPNYPNYYQRSIMLDICRTKRSQLTEQDTKSLQNILMAFSRRNPFIGYCQGLNFIAYFLLTMQFQEEEAFWILSQITETIIPMDYYTNMIGVACDQQIFLQILKIKKPNIIQKFHDVGLDGSVLSIQWFVCLFASSLPFYLVKIVWDRLLVQGTQAFIKAATNLKDKLILQLSQYSDEIIMLVEQGSKNLQMSQQQFNKQFDKYYINQQGLKIARDLYRQFHIKQKLQQKINAKPTNKNKKHEPIICDIKWPLCIQSLNQSRKNITEIQIWTYRQESSPKIIHDYLENMKKKNATLTSTIMDQKALLRSATITPTQICDYVIGRMEHICQHKKAHFEPKIQKHNNNAKFLSMVLQEEQDDDKKISNLQKIIRLSEMFPSENKERNQSFAKSGFEKSQTIQFYSQFVSNNKQLAEMLAGKK